MISGVECVGTSASAKRSAGRRARRSQRLLGISIGMLLGVSMLPCLASAALERVEAVGSYGIRERLRTRVTPRDEAVQEAIWEGVSRVAIEQIGELASTDEDVAILKQALGDDMLPYTRSFRIIEDKGESPVLFAEDPGIKTEYIVVVEMLVDVSRVQSALVGAGLIAGGNVEATGEPVLVELIGIERFDAFQSIRAALVSELGASRVDTLGFARERQLLSVVGPFDPAGLSAALERLDNADWSLSSIGIDESGRRIRLRGDVSR